MKKSVLVALIASLFLLLGGAALAETIVGVVAEGGMASLRVKSEAGEELHLYNQRGMVVEPKNYRAQKGDRVELVYEMKHSRSKGREVPMITTLKMVKIAERNKTLVSPVTGTIEEVGRSRVRVLVTETGKATTFDFKRGMPKVENAIEKPKAGDKVRVFFSAVPARFGKGYVYQLHGFQRL